MTAVFAVSIAYSHLWAMYRPIVAFILLVSIVAVVAYSRHRAGRKLDGLNRRITPR